MIWIPLILCLLLAFMLSGIESALLTVNRVRVRYIAEEGNARAAKLFKLLEFRNELLHAATALCHLASLTAFALAAAALVHLIGNWGWAVAILLALPVFLMGLELVPKLLFKRYSFQLLCHLTGVLAILRVIAKPMLWIARRLRPKNFNLPLEENTQQGIEPLVETISGLQILSPNTHDLLGNLVKFQEVKITDVMTPLRNLTALPPEMPLQNALVLTRQQRHPWRAVLDEKGDLLGWLDVLSIPAKPLPDRIVRQYLRPLAECKLTDAPLRSLQMLRKRGEPLAAVLDESGKTVGVLTQESLLKALFRGATKTSV